MKSWIMMVFVLMVSGFAQAGLFIPPGKVLPYDVVVGQGPTLKKAMEDARKAIPKPTADAKYIEKSEPPQIVCIDQSIWSESQECSGKNMNVVVGLEKR